MTLVAMATAYVYQAWRRDVDGDRARLSLLGRLAIIALGGNALAIAAAVYAAIK